MHATMALSQPLNEPALLGPNDLGSVALLLDIDGTILDLAVTPGSVVVSDTLRASLGELHAKCDGALALVSGRVIRDIDTLFAPLRLPAIGGHGAEMRLVAATPARERHADAISDKLRKLMVALAATDSRIILEDKASSIAIHYRLAPDMEHAIKNNVAALTKHLAGHGIEVLHGKSVVEIKSSHFSKGMAVTELMKCAPFAHRRPVFIGDDTTDLSVFEVLPTLGGVGYSVERLMPGAAGMFRSPREVRGWLAALCGRWETVTR
jgi:trehalose 6-phosphate phosphatase